MTRLSHPARRLVLGSALLLIAAGHASWAAEPNEFSRAENLVFVDPQLANVKTPTLLRYSYVKSGSLEPGFEDQVQLDVRPAKNAQAPGQSTVRGSFLSGERQVQLPEIPDAQANPVILFFLERDIREMERLTKGKSGYFRKRIRMSMVDAAEVRETTVNYGGHDVPAQEVSLAPYEKDPMRARFEKYAQKRYTFVLASAVPGGVYQVRSALPGALPSDAPVLEEVMTLSGAEAAPAATSAATSATTPASPPNKARKP